jgi:outer membrane protein assembly factor BamB
MSLTTVSRESREVKEPDQLNKVVFRRTVSSNSSSPSLTDYEVRGYSSEFGGQKVEPIDVTVTTQNRTDGASFLLDIDFEFDTSSAGPGSDFIVEYTVDDGAVTETSSFFYKNGVYSDDAPAQPLTFRSSAELERISETFLDEEDAEELTDFSDTTRRASSPFEFISDSSPYQKHSSEPVPYFAGSGTLEFPAQAFSSRESSILLVLQWNQIPTEDFPVATVEQDGKTYLEVRNDQGDVRLESEFAGSTFYESETYTGEVLIAECRISGSSVEGSVNREVTSGPTNLTGSFSSGTTIVEMNPDGKDISPKLFDVITYDGPITTRELDRLAKQHSYFYDIDLSEPQITSAYSGSPIIEEHVFYNEETEEYDVFWTGGDVWRYDPDGTGTWSFAQVDGNALAIDARGEIGLGTDIGNDVHRLTPGGKLIWTYPGHSDTINGVEVGREENVYSASEDGTAKKLGPAGSPVWNFGAHGGPVNDIAVYEELAVYTASDDNTVRRLGANNGQEVWSFTGHLAEVTALEVDDSQVIYSVAANGELRAIDEDGNEEYVVEPFSGQFQTCPPIEDLAVGGDGVYVVSGDWLKKLDPTDGSEIWKQDVFGSNANKTAELDSVAVSPTGNAWVAENLENNILEFDGTTGSKVSEFSVPSTTRDFSVQPGTFQPHWI